jgi:hypothetical protein
LEKGRPRRALSRARLTDWRIPAQRASLAGKPVCRPADLVFIGTTSLYGQRPSQYERIVVPCDPAARGGPGLRYDYLGKTKGLGTFQFGEQTVSDLALLCAQSEGGQRVNSVFGEGVNARLRKIREGLDGLGLPTDDLLDHGGPRLVYGVELIQNTHAYLLGQDKRPKYILSSRSPAETTARIALVGVQVAAEPHRSGRGARAGAPPQLRPPHPAWRPGGTAAGRPGRRDRSGVCAADEPPVTRRTTMGVAREWPPVAPRVIGEPRGGQDGGQQKSETIQSAAEADALQTAPSEGRGPACNVSFSRPNERVFRPRGTLGGSNPT